MTLGVGSPRTDLRRGRRGARHPHPAHRVAPFAQRTGFLSRWTRRTWRVGRRRCASRSLGGGRDRSVNGRCGGRAQSPSHDLEFGGDPPPSSVCCPSGRRWIPILTRSPRFRRRLGGLMAAGVFTEEIWGRRHRAVDLLLRDRWRDDLGGDGAHVVRTPRPDYARSRPLSRVFLGLRRVLTPTPTPSLERKWFGLGVAWVAGGGSCAAVAFIDPARTALGPPCPFKVLTGWDCPLCGATRATHQLLHAHVGRALDLNALYLAVLPFVVWMLLAAAVARIVGRELPRIRPSLPPHHRSRHRSHPVHRPAHLPIGPGRYPPHIARRARPVEFPFSRFRAERERVAEVEIGIGKSGRRAYGFDDIAIVPSRRTRDPEDVDISWEIDAFRFELPLMGAPWTASSARPPPSRSAGSAAWACSTSKASGPATRTRSRCSRRSPSSTTTRPPPGCSRSTPSRSSPS